MKLIENKPNVEIDRLYSSRCWIKGLPDNVYSFLMKLRSTEISDILNTIDITIGKDKALESCIPEILDSFINNEDYQSLDLKDLDSLKEYKKELENLYEKLQDSSFIGLANYVGIKNLSGDLFDKIHSTVIAIMDWSIDSNLIRLQTFVEYGLSDKRIIGIFKELESKTDSDGLNRFFIDFHTSDSPIKYLNFISQIYEFDIRCQIVQYEQIRSNRIDSIVELVIKDGKIEDSLEWSKEDIEEVHKISLLVDY